MATEEEYYWQKMAAKYPNDPQYEQFDIELIIHSDCCDELMEGDDLKYYVCPKCKCDCNRVEQDDSHGVSVYRTDN